MRRGTPTAKVFGDLLYYIRTANGQTMRQVANRLGEKKYAATVSQIERGERVVQYPDVSNWAEALNVDSQDLHDLWWLSHGHHYNGEFFEDKQELFKEIQKIMYKINVNIKFTLDLSEIKPKYPLTRRRQKSISQISLTELIAKLTATEKNRVRGYVEGILSERNWGT